MTAAESEHLEPRPPEDAGACCGAGVGDLSGRARSETPSGTGVPPAVLAAAALWRRRRGERASQQASSQPVARGDLWTINAVPAGGGVRVGLVCDAGPQRDYVTVMLAHPAAEMATGCDAVIAASAAACAYDVVVQTDLRSVVWSAQLGRCVGRLDPLRLEAVAEVAQHAAAPAVAASDCRVRSGTHLAGALDPRWQFKLSENAALHVLSAACAETLLTAQPSDTSHSRARR